MPVNPILSAYCTSTGALDPQWASRLLRGTNFNHHWAAVILCYT